MTAIPTPLPISMSQSPTHGWTHGMQEWAADPGRFGQETEGDVQRVRGDFPESDRHILGHSKEADWALGGAALGFAAAMMEFLARGVQKTSNNVGERKNQVRRMFRERKRGKKKTSRKVWNRRPEMDRSPLYIDIESEVSQTFPDFDLSNTDADYGDTYDYDDYSNNQLQFSHRYSSLYPEVNKQLNQFRFDLNQLNKGYRRPPRKKKKTEIREWTQTAKTNETKQTRKKNRFDIKQLMWDYSQREKKKEENQNKHITTKKHTDKVLSQNMIDFRKVMRNYSKRKKKKRLANKNKAIMTIKKTEKVQPNNSQKVNRVKKTPDQAVLEEVNNRIRDSAFLVSSERTPTVSPWDRLSSMDRPLPDSFMDNLHSAFSIKNQAENQANLPSLKKFEVINAVPQKKNQRRKFDKKNNLVKESNVDERIMAYTNSSVSEGMQPYQPPINAYVGIPGR